MSDSTFNAREYNRSNWTLLDLRTLVTDTESWDDTAEVRFTLFESGSRRSRASVEVRALVP